MCQSLTTMRLMRRLDPASICATYAQLEPRWDGSANFDCRLVLTSHEMCTSLAGKRRTPVRLSMPECFCWILSLKTLKIRAVCHHGGNTLKIFERTNSRNEPLKESFHWFWVYYPDLVFKEASRRMPVFCASKLKVKGLTTAKIFSVNACLISISITVHLKTLQLSEALSWTPLWQKYFINQLCLVNERVNTWRLEAASKCDVGK